MLYSHAWLRTLVPGLPPAEEVRELIGRHVATVDAVETLRRDLAPIVVARVVEAGRHPNSDHLWVTKVDDGSGQLLDVVCGAPNVTAGTLYPFARTGTTLPGGVKIEKRKIRGEVSNGMLCSARELALGEEHDGILALTVDAAPGTPFLQAVPLGDVRLDVDVLPNRPDLFSHLGMARELAALTGGASVEPAMQLAIDPISGAIGWGDAGAMPAIAGPREASSGGATVRLEDADGCPRYMAVVIRGVTVGPSPEWLVRLLDAVGVRSISNVVDVTNYFVHGYGQPMHAFDLAKLSDRTIVVRRARAGEKLVTLDGVERTLDERMTVIADPARAVAVAGVMGGRDTEVTHETTDLLLEVAYFSPRHVRATRRALNLTTDASYRFERGIDPQGTPQALRLAAELIAALGGGRVDGAPIDVGSPTPDPREVPVTASRISRLLGDGVSADEVRALLEGIGFRVEAGPADSLVVTPPSWRGDVTRDADLVEEVARLRGYDVLSDEIRAFLPTTAPDHRCHVTTQRAREALVGAGLFEVRPLPFVKGDDATHVRVKNPLADDEPHYRTSILETLARRAEYNLSRMQGNVRLFEVGSVLEPASSSLPKEEVRVGALLMGARRPPHFTEPNPPAFDEWDAKALAERVVAIVADEACTLEPGDGAGVLWRITSVGAEIGRVVRVALDRPVWASPAFGIEVLVAAMPNANVAAPGSHDYAAHAGSRKPAFRPYRPLPSTPAVTIDLALVVPDERSAGDVERVLTRSGGELLEHLELFDEFRGGDVPAGHRSLAWRLTFRDPVRTLRDKEIEGRRQKVLRALEGELGVRPRSV